MCQALSFCHPTKHHNTFLERLNVLYCFVLFVPMRTQRSDGQQVAEPGSNPHTYDPKPMFSDTFWQSNWQKQQPRGRKMSVEIEADVEYSQVIKSTAASYKCLGSSLGYIALVTSKKHWRGWNSYQKPNHPLSRKQILNFANPEPNTKVQRDKYKHIRLEREHLRN